MEGSARAAEIEVGAGGDPVEECHRRGWTDGLPVVPPTTERVARMLEHAGLAPDRVLGEVPMRRRVLTADRAAANAVMAGCLPVHFPVVLAALAALFEHDPNVVHEISAATNAPGFLILVNGPIRRRLGLSCRDNLLSSTSRPNATIGRALRLILLNVFESREGALDRACMGSLSKLGLCFGEDEERSPWPPLHTTRGFAADESTVTMASIQDPETLGNRYGRTAESIMDAVADAMATHGLGAHFTFMANAWLWVVGHWHAATLAGQGWDRPRMQRYVWERAWRSRADLKRLGMMRGEILPEDAGVPVRAAASPDDILIVRAGGDSGLYSTVIKIYIGMPATTVRVQEPATGRSVP